MKFGQHLQEAAYGPYQGHYIAYKDLKKAINLITGTDTSQWTISEVTSNFSHTEAFAGSAQRPPEARFQALLNHEVEKINNFAVLTYTQILTNIQTVMSSIASAQSIVDLTNAHTKAEAIADEIAHLDAFVKLNLTGFRKITKKYDKHSRGSSSTWYMSQLLQAPFLHLDFDSLIRKIAQAFQALYGKQNVLVPPSRSLSTPTSSSHPIQSTYLLPSEEIMQARLQLAKHLPLMSTGKEPIKAKFLETEQLGGAAVTPAKISLDNNNRYMSTAICNYDHQRSHGCLYFDNSHNWEVYMNVLNHSMRKPYHFYTRGLEVMRLRWPVNQPDTSEVKSSSAHAQLPLSKVPSSESGLASSKAFNVLLEFVHPAAYASDPHEWFEVPFDNHMESPISSRAVLLSAFRVDELLNKTFDVDLWMKEQLAVKPPLSSQRLETMKTLLLKAIQCINDLGYTPTFQRWCHRTRYEGPLLELSSSESDCASECEMSGHSVDRETSVSVNASQPIQSSKDQSVISQSTSTQRDPEFIYAHLDEHVRFIPWDVDSPLSFAEKTQDMYLLSGSSKVFKQASGLIFVTRPKESEPLLHFLGSTTNSEILNYSPLLHGCALQCRTQFSHHQLPPWFKFVSQAEDPVSVAKPRPLPSVSRDYSNVQSSPSSDPHLQAQHGESIRVDVLPTHPSQKVLHDHAATTSLKPSSLKQNAAARQSVSRGQTGADEGGPSGVTSTTSQFAFDYSNLREPLIRNGERHRQDAYCVELMSMPESRAMSRFSFMCSALRHQWSCVKTWLTRHLRVFSEQEVRDANVRIEPKTFFANERTLLQWMNTAVLLSTISVTLLNFGAQSGRYAGFLLAPIAIFLILYSFMLYMHRNRCLKEKKIINYDNHLGPAILTVSLTFALTAIITLNLTKV